MMSYMAFILILRFRTYQNKMIARRLIILFIGAVIYIISKIISLVMIIKGENNNDNHFYEYIYIFHKIGETTYTFGICSLSYRFLKIATILD